MEVTNGAGFPLFSIITPIKNTKTSPWFTQEHKQAVLFAFKVTVTFLTPQKTLKPARNMIPFGGCSGRTQILPRPALLTDNESNFAVVVVIATGHHGAHGVVHHGHDVYVKVLKCRRGG